MDSKEQDERQKDSGVTIVDLDTSRQKSKRAILWNRKAFLPLFRFKAPNYRFSLLLTGIFGLLALMLLVGSYTPVRQWFMPVQSGTPTPIKQELYVSGSPAWGQLRVDGKMHAYVPWPETLAPLRLSPGQHTLRWEADQFRPRECIISEPLDRTRDTCSFSTHTSKDGKIVKRVVDFHQTIDAMSNDERSRLVAAVEATLDKKTSTETIKPGELFVLSDPAPQVTIAREPLTATLRFELIHNREEIYPCKGLYGDDTCIYDHQDCHRFCDVQVVFGSGVDIYEWWRVLVVVRHMWDYIKSDGTILAQDQLASHGAAIGRMGTYVTHDHLVPLQIKWERGEWKVEALFPSYLPPSEAFEMNASGGYRDIASRLNPTCSLAWDEVDVLGVGQDALAYVMGSALENPATGCLLVNFRDSDRLGGPPLYLLHRFGVLLAANGEAKRVYPQLPLAPEYLQPIIEALVSRVRDVG